MKRLIFLILVLGLGFYVGWPAWSGYQIKNALEAGDPKTLQQKIDFPSVRDSLRPAARLQAERMLDEALQSSSSPVATVLDPDTKQRLLPKMVDSTLDRIVTPDNLIRIARHGGTIKEAVATVVKEQMGGAMGGLPGLANLGNIRVQGSEGSDGDLSVGELVGGIVGAATGKDNVLGGLFGGTKKREPKPAPSEAPKAPAAKSKPKLGIDNITHVGFAGPLGLELGLAEKPGAKKDDVTIEMGFRDLDWKLVAVRPRL